MTRPLATAALVSLTRSYGAVNIMHSTYGVGVRMLLAHHLSYLPPCPRTIQTQRFRPAGFSTGLAVHGGQGWRWLAPLPVAACGWPSLKA